MSVTLFSTKTPWNQITGQANILIAQLQSHYENRKQRYVGYMELTFSSVAIKLSWKMTGQSSLVTYTEGSFRSTNIKSKKAEQMMKNEEAQQVLEHQIQCNR